MSLQKLYYTRSISKIKGKLSSHNIFRKLIKLLEFVADFKKGAINVLIATNVIEEGLDVSECNLVICVNELVNVKAFIQMKGRAR